MKPLIASEHFNSYNERRYSRPWAALVTYETPTAKPSYDFTNSTYDGKHGDAGDAIVGCAPYDIVAFGQRDNRKPSGTENNMYIVLPVAEAPEGFEPKDYHTVTTAAGSSGQCVLVRTTPAAGRKHFFSHLQTGEAA